MFPYPAMNQSYKEVAYVVKSQGTGIKTVRVAVPPTAPKAAGVSTAVFGPQLITPNGDGWADWGYVAYTIDQPALVTASIYDFGGHRVALLANQTRQNAGRY